MNLAKLQHELQGKVQREYSMGFNHIEREIERKRGVLYKLFDPSLPEGQVRIPLFKKNLELENALFLTDEIDIQFLTNGGVLGEQIMKNANMVAKYDDIDMDLYEIREDIVNHNGLYGLSATIIDGYDDDEEQPISDSISPLNLIIDPKNYKGSRLRFIGVRRRLNLDDVLNNPAFDTNQVKKIQENEDMEITKTARQQDQAGNQQYQNDNEGMVDIYDHFTIHNGMKVLTTWGADRSILIRYMEIEPLSKAEQLKPTKVKFPIQLHRRKPRPGCVFGFSIADEVIVYQDIISQLINLQIINSRILALGPDIFVDSKLGVDTTLLGKGKPGGRILPINNQTGMPTQNGIYSFTTPPPSQYIDQLVNTLEQRAEETTSISKQSFGITQDGNQTKAESQMLQQNANNILKWIANNYLRGEKDYWTEHYRTYARSMGPKKKKVVSLFQKGDAMSLELKREDFLADGKVQVIVVSKNQETLENEKEFNKLTFIANLFLPNISSEYAKNELLRLMGEKSNVRDFDSKKYIRESIEEIKAKASLPLLNRNLKEYVSMPGISDNVDIYIDIYKQAMNVDIKQEIMAQLYQIKELQATKQTMQTAKDEMGGVKDAQSGAMAMNNINQQTQAI